MEVFARGGGERADVALKRPTAASDVPMSAHVGSVEMAGDEPRWSTFQINPAFVAFYVSYMRGEHDLESHMLKEARGKPGDWLYVIDGRVRDPSGNVPFRDIIGWYRADEHGRALAESFEYNGDHVLFGEGGPSSLLNEPNVHALVYGGHLLP